MVAAAIGTAAVASAAGSAISGSMQSDAATSAADTQAAAADRASANQLAMYNQTRADLGLFRSVGENSINGLQNLLNLGGNNNLLDSPLLKSFNPTQADLEKTPGYQFNLSQGLRAVQNSAAARGLGVSGAAMRGAADYATGLADNTYQNQFNNYVTNQTNQFNRLMGVAQMGQNAAAQTGSFGTQTAANIGNNITGAGNAAAAGQIGSANAIAGGISGAANSPMNFLMMNSLLKSGGGAGITL